MLSVRRVQVPQAVELRWGASVHCDQQGHGELMDCRAQAAPAGGAALHQAGTRVERVAAASRSVLHGPQVARRLGEEYPRQSGRLAAAGRLGEQERNRSGPAAQPSPQK
jgi:hypothetical protein